MKKLLIVTLWFTFLPIFSYAQTPTPTLTPTPQVAWFILPSIQVVHTLPNGFKFTATDPDFKSVSTTAVSGPLGYRWKTVKYNNGQFFVIVKNSQANINILTGYKGVTLVATGVSPNALGQTKINNQATAMGMGKISISSETSGFK